MGVDEVVFFGVGDVVASNANTSVARGDGGADWDVPLCQGADSVGGPL